MSYIDRDAALSFPFANREYDRKHANEHFIYGCETYKEWLEGLPTADVTTVIHAHWIDCCGPIDDFLANCSHCGYQMDTHEERGYHRFCPHCGARMDERSEDNG